MISDTPCRGTSDVPRVFRDGAYNENRRQLLLVRKGNVCYIWKQNGRRRGISICAGSRPHPDFAGPGWWHDLDIVLDEAKKRGMRVWILDDAHFPTGQANGLIPKQYPQLLRRYVFTQHVDVTGPIPWGSLDVGMMTTRKST